MVTQYTTVLDALPLWGLFPVIVVLVLAAIEGGYRLGAYRQSLSGREKDAPCRFDGRQRQRSGCSTLTRLSWAGSSSRSMR